MKFMNFILQILVVSLLKMDVFVLRNPVQGKFIAFYFIIQYLILESIFFLLMIIQQFGHINKQTIIEVYQNFFLERFSVFKIYTYEV